MWGDDLSQKEYIWSNDMSGMCAVWVRCGAPGSMSHIMIGRVSMLMALRASNNSGVVGGMVVFDCEGNRDIILMLGGDVSMVIVRGISLRIWRHLVFPSCECR